MATPGDGLVSSQHFTSDEQRPCRPELMFAYRGLVPGHGRSDRHTPGWFSSWRVDEGWAEVRFATGAPLRADVGEWLLCPPYLPRYQTFPRGARIISVAFQMSAPAGVDLGVGMPLVLGVRAGAALTTPARDLLARLGPVATSDQDQRLRHRLTLVDWLGAQQALTAFVAAWLHARGGEAPSATAQDQRVRAARAALTVDARMGPVPYAALERRTGLGRVHLDRLFKAVLGATPKQELDRLCLERVLYRLADPERPVKAIAREVGFTDSSHLCRWFARRVGLSPERYRRQAQA